MSVKLIANYMISVFGELFFETFAFLKAGGISPPEAHAALLDELMPRVFAGYAGRMAENPGRPRSAQSAIGREDSRLLIEAARAAGVYIPARSIRLSHRVTIAESHDKQGVTMTIKKSEILTSNALIYSGKGGPEVIQFARREVRAPEADEVRIQMKAAAVNPTDIMLREMGAPEWPGIVPGMDAAGIVEAVGAGVSRLKVGDKVIAAVWPRRAEGGAQAEHIVVPAASVVAAPDGASFSQASTLPMNGLTALRSIELCELRKGQTLAVSGGVGVLAHYTIAIAKDRGIRTIADAKPEDVDLVKSYGTEIVVPRGPDFASEVRRAFPEGVDALIDTAVLSEKAFPALRDGGTYIPVRFWRDKPLDPRIQIKPVAVVDVLQRTEWLDELRRLASTGKIKLQVAKEYPPAELGEAQQLFSAGGVRGRPVIVFDVEG